MSEVAARELRNRTAEVLARVEAGEQVIITTRGCPVAELVPVRTLRRRPIPRAELVQRLRQVQADPGLRSELAELALSCRSGCWPSLIWKPGHGAW